MTLPIRTIAAWSLGLLLASAAHAADPGCQSVLVPSGVVLHNNSGIVGPYGATVSAEGCAVSRYADTFASGYSFQAAAQASSVAVHASAATTIWDTPTGATPTISALAESVLPFSVNRLSTATASLALVEFEVVGDGQYGSSLAPDTLVSFAVGGDLSSAPGTSRSSRGVFHDSQGTNNNWDGRHTRTGAVMNFDFTQTRNAFFEAGANYVTMTLSASVRGVGFADLYNTSKLVGIRVVTPGFELSFADNAFVPDPQLAGHYLLNLPTAAPAVPEPDTWALMLAGLLCILVVTPRRSRTHIGLALAMGGALMAAGCGGGGGGKSSEPVAQPAAVALTVDNAWTAPIPQGAEVVSTPEFERRLADGTLTLIAPDTSKAARAALDADFQSRRAALAAWADKPAYVQALLDQTASDTAHPADTALTLPGGQQVMLLGRGAQVAAAAEAMVLSRSAENALHDYVLTFGLLPSDVKAKLPDPDSLRGQPVEAIRTALSQINQLLGQPEVSSRMTHASLDTGDDSPSGKGPRVSRQSAVVPVPGAGQDNDDDGKLVCAPKHDAAIYWFPLKKFVSPTKQQGNRNTCWAFGAIGALESRERVLNDNPVNLSEQFLVNKVRREWFPNDLVETGSSKSALDAAVAHGQAIPTEASWTYNPSYHRSLLKEKVNGVDVQRFVNSCSKANGTDPYTGTCSNAVHQSHQVCTDAQLTHCAYDTMLASGPTVPPSPVIQIWQQGGVFDLERFEFLLNNGHAIITSLPVYDGFANPTTGAYPGLVTDFRGVHTDDKGQVVGGSAGDHVVQIVGFLPNKDGGLFIIKNSWGCKWGDGGYAYVPTAYVQAHFQVMYILDFESRRSAGWQAEQASRLAAPAVQVKPPPLLSDLRKEFDLTSYFSVSHPIEKSVVLSVSSDRDGVLFNGNWSTDTSALIPPQLPVRFTTEGARTITLSAHLSGSAKTVTGTFVVDVVNSAPQVAWQYTGTAFQGEPFSVNALVSDINEADATDLCRNATWSVDAPDAVLSPNGCAQRVTFGATGDRLVRISVRDSDGRDTAATLKLSVQAPPVNPFPRLLSYGVYAREFTGTLAKFCGEVAQPSGTTLDLRAKGCSVSGLGPNPSRLLGAITVENPAKEALSYEWKLYVKSEVGSDFAELYGGTGPTFDLFGFGNANLVTRDCRVDVTVVASQPERSKHVTAWSGRCVYLASVLN
jgi:hypothetical protein